MPGENTGRLITISILIDMPDFDSYTIKTFRGGISSENDKGPTGSFKAGYAGNIRKRNDTYSCHQAMNDVTPAALSGMIRHMVSGSDGSMYAFDASGSIWARSGDGEWTFLYSDENGEIKGADEWTIKDGSRYLIWATETSLARAAIDGSPDTPWAAGVATQDFKTDLASVDHHTMKTASGSLMIANKDSLAALDRLDNWDPVAANIREGNVIKALDERDDYAIMGSGRGSLAEQGHIWSWVITTLDWVQKKLIPVKGINSMVTTEFPIIQGGTDGEFFTSDFVTTTPLNGVPGGGQVRPDGVTIKDDVALFGIYGTTDGTDGLWSLGRKRSNHPFALNYDYRLSPTVSGSTVTEIGSVEMHNGTLLASWETVDGSTTEYGIDQISTTTKAAALYEGLEFDAGEPHLNRWHRMITVMMKPLPSQTSVSAKFKLDDEDNWRYAVLGDGSTTHAVSSGHSSTKAEFTCGNKGKSFEVGLELNPNSNDTPEVSDIVTLIEKIRYEHD